MDGKDSWDMDAAVLDLKEKALKKDGVYWLGIVGIPGSGKSTLAEKLIAKLKDDHGVVAQCVPMDGYHYSKKELDAFDDPEEAHFRRGAHFTFNGEAFVDDIKQCQSDLTKPYWFPNWEHAKADPSPGKIEVDPRKHKIVIVEGLYLLLPKPDPWPEFRSLLDTIWFLDIDLDTAVERVAKRNAAAWNWTYEKTMERVKKSDFLNMKLVLEGNPKELVDVVINNN
mmetsp:Transcript_19608/g.32247  ORF Transcript_19608/g.32247 Transcript_19608/m.32247 type:complete len:225 (+) Transcript_19608:397-1071(+)